MLRGAEAFLLFCYCLGEIARRGFELCHREQGVRRHVQMDHVTKVGLNPRARGGGGWLQGVG